MSWLRGVATLAAVVLLAGCTASSEPGADQPSRQPASSGDGSARTTAPAPTPEGLARFYDQKVRWSGCGGRFECAKVTVPVDYAKPAGPTIELAVNRLPTRGSGRLGSLLINPGGPGVSGFDYARAAESVISADVRNHYDVVGFDPRGVGRSAPIRCLTDHQTDVFIAADGSPDTEAERAQLVRLSKQLGERCAARNGALLSHVGTPDAARDMDVIRSVVGDAKLNYLGKSYGTYLGATYADLFPKSVGRVVLDGVVDPAADVTTLARAQAVGFETALGAFVDDCLKRRDCPLSGSRAHALGQVSALLAAADRSPLRAGRPVGQSLASLGVAYAMYYKSLWEPLREALGQAQHGNGQLLLLLADSYAERSDNGHYPSNVNDVIYAINCLDRPETSDVTAVEQRATELAKVAPRFGAYVAWSTLPCGFWPVPAQSQPHPVRAAGAAPILVVGTTRDPATPYAFARNVARELQSARLLTFNGDGHTAYGKGSSCIDQSVDRYLLAGRLPPKGTRCS